MDYGISQTFVARVFSLSIFTDMYPQSIMKTRIQDLIRVINHSATVLLVC